MGLRLTGSKGRFGKGGGAGVRISRKDCSGSANSHR